MLHIAEKIAKVKWFAAVRTVEGMNHDLDGMVKVGAEPEVITQQAAAMALVAKAAACVNPAMSEASSSSLTAWPGSERPGWPPKGNSPCTCFRPFLRRVSEQKAALDQVPASAPAPSTAAILSAAVGNSVVVERAHRDKDTYFNLYASSLRPNAVAART